MTILQAVGHSEVNSLKIMFQQQSADVTQQKQGKYFFHLFCLNFCQKSTQGNQIGRIFICYIWATFWAIFLQNRLVTQIEVASYFYQVKKMVKVTFVASTW
jgi:hypothetical protein